MAFNKDHPPPYSQVVSPQLRENFRALAKLQRDNISPYNPEIGWWWLDSSDPENEKLKVYAIGEKWVTVFEYMNSMPTPANPKHEDTRDPDQYDNTAAGYINYHLWLNTNTDEVFILVDAPLGIWKSITASVGPSGGGVPTRENKYMSAAVTTADEDLACATGMQSTPLGFGYVTVQVNGVTMPVGNGVKNRSCYFSADDGVTAKTWPAVVAGDKLYWMGSIAGFQLSNDDVVEFFYDIAA